MAFSRPQDAWSAQSLDTPAVLAQARALQCAARVGSAQAPLRGRKLALLNEGADAGAVELFCSAAANVGAHVAILRPGLSAHSVPKDIAQFARVLGRLYEAVNCEGVAPDLAGEIARGAGVPVFIGLASPGHPSAVLAGRLDGGDGWRARRSFIVQAMLLASLA